jgi:hypothetical protein
MAEVVFVENGLYVVGVGYLHGEPDSARCGVEVVVVSGAAGGRQFLD